MTSQDHRHFRRYFAARNLALKFRKWSYKAEMKDYSPAGVGAVMTNTAPLGKGDVVQIISEDPVTSMIGEVVWSLIEGPSLRLGIANVGRLEGRTADYELADMLIGLQRDNKTGVLTVESGSIAKKIFIKAGDMIFASSNQDQDRLGDILLRQGRITREHYDQSVREMMRTGQRQGGVLVRLGCLEPKELWSVVTHQVEEIIESLFELQESRFDFEQRPLPCEEVITLRLSAANLIYRGIKRVTDLSRIIREPAAMDSVLSFSASPLNLFQDLRLDDAGLKIVSCVDGRTSIKDIIAITQLDDFVALKTIYALLSVRTLELTGTGTAFTEMPEEVIKNVVEGSRERESTVRTDKIREMIESMHERCESLGHYGVLDVKSNASVAEIKAAYYRAAKTYHPDVHFHLDDNSLKDKLSDIFSSVYEAYTTLSDPQERKEYDKMTTIKPARLRSVQEKAEVAFAEGKDLLKKKEYADAERLFGQAAYLERTISEYHYYYGMTLAMQRKYKEAEKALDRARRLDPHNAKYLAELGFVYLSLGLRHRARGTFEKALSIAPDNVRAAEGMAKSAAD